MSLMTGCRRTGIAALFLVAAGLTVIGCLELALGAFATGLLGLAGACSTVVSAWLVRLNWLLIIVNRDLTGQNARLGMLLAATADRRGGPGR